MVERRCATTSVVLPCCKAFSAPWTTRSRLGVEGGGRFVQQQDRRIAEHGAGDRDPLALPAGQLDAELAHHRVVAVGKPHDEIMGGGTASGCDDLFLRGANPTIGDVGADAIVEQRRLPG